MLIFLVPVLLIAAIIYIYRFTGKREILQLDLVQFLFAFLVYPVTYIWLKNFLYFLLRSEIGVALSLREWINIDTAFTVFFMYFYAFGIIHALTKTFSLNLHRDPLYDIFEDSKYFHEFISHVGMYVAAVILFAVLGILNCFFPIQVEQNRSTLYLILALGWIMGFFAYLGAFYTTDKGVDYHRYRRIMKLAFGLSFLTLSISYFVIHPLFSLKYSAFWFVLLGSASTIVSMFLFSPTRRFGRLLGKLKIQGID